MGRRQRVVDADDIYYLEAQGDETDVRLAPPVNKLLAVSRGSLAALRKACRAARR